MSIIEPKFLKPEQLSSLWKIHFPGRNGHYFGEFAAL